MYITEYYHPNKGLTVISPVGTQQYTEKLNSFSQVYSAILNSEYNDKYSIDSCWESGNIYYANYDSGYVKKIQFDGTEIASLKLVNPVCVSVIQNGLVMARSIPVTPQEDGGCWIADKGTARIIKTDRNLNILYIYSGVSNPKCIAVDVDGGCIVADDGSEKVIKLSPTAQKLAILNYDYFSPPITASNEFVKEIKPFKFVDLPAESSSSSRSSSGSTSSSSSSSSINDIERFWILANAKVYLVSYLGGILYQSEYIDPLVGLPVPVYPDKVYNVGSIDVDLYERYLYVGIGNDKNTWIRKYAGTTEILKKQLDIQYPYVLKVVQGYGSTCLYVLSDEYKIDEMVSSSSSSSSSISSSSSSSSTWIKTSSSSSSSSMANLKKGPYLIYPDTNTEMTVLWQTFYTHTCFIEWGTDVTYSDGSDTTTEYGTDHQHQYNITGLTPGTKYYYRVNGHTGSFKSAPDEAASSVKFLVYGDTRTNPDKQDMILEQALLVVDGDQDYQTIITHAGDWANTNTESAWQNEFFPRNWSNIMEFQSRVPIMGCMGNHEGAGTMFTKYLPYPEFETGERYYAFEYGPVKFVVIDQYDTYTVGSPQYVWLVNELSSNTKEWLMIVLHSPAYCDDGSHGADLTARTILQPLCIQYGVDMVLCGHNHFYAHCVSDEVEWLTVGAGGAPLQNIAGTGTGLVYSEKQYCFAKVEITPAQLTFTAIDGTDGSTMETFIILNEHNWSSSSSSSF